MEINITYHRLGKLLNIINNHVTGEALPRSKDLVYLKHIGFIDITIANQIDLTYVGAEYLLEHYPMHVDNNYKKQN